MAYVRLSFVLSIPPFNESFAFYWLACVIGGFVGRLKHMWLFLCYINIELHSEDIWMSKSEQKKKNQDQKLLSFQDIFIMQMALEDTDSVSSRSIGMVCLLFSIWR